MLNNKLFSDLTTLQIGGPIGRFVEVKTEEELINTLQSAHKENIPFLIIGSGSNLLVSDSGFEGLVIKNSIIGIVQEGRTLKVKSGAILQNLVDFANDNGLSGLQKLTGIPGTVGGAVYGNAGAYGQIISDHISSVVILKPTAVSSSNLIGGSIKIDSRWSLPRTSIRGGNDNLKVVILTKKECQFGYRESIFKQTKDIILEITFELEQGDPKTLKKESEEILEKRLVKYPKGIKCPGSFFMNIIAENLPKEVLEKIPQDMIMYGKIPAGALLEEVGAKGDSIDGIEIAPYHANLFVNKGGGSAKDFYELAKKYKEKVKIKFGISLEPEVQLINLPPLN